MNGINTDSKTLLDCMSNDLEYLDTVDLINLLKEIANEMKERKIYGYGK